MLRVIILAHSTKSAQALADVLRRDRAFEIAGVRASSTLGRHPAGLPAADVLLAEGLSPEELPLDGPPIVLLSGEADGQTALVTGVHACLPLDATPEELSAALFAAAREFTVLTPAQAARWLRHPGHAEDDENPGMPT